MNIDIIIPMGFADAFAYNIIYKYACSCACNNGNEYANNIYSHGIMTIRMMMINVNNRIEDINNK